MSKTALIISAAETFSVRGLEMKLKSIDVGTIYAAPKIKELEEKCPATDIIILYTDESIDSTADASCRLYTGFL